MNTIIVTYDNEIIENQKFFDKVIGELKELYTNNISFNVSKDIKFQILFNSKVIYSLDDNFDPDACIDKKVLDKAVSYIANSIILNKSKNISRVDDIGIDDF